MAQTEQLPLLVLGADHGGLELKETLKEWLAGQGYPLEDLGASSYEPTDDYPTYAFAVAERVSAAEADGRQAFGLLLCRTGGGMTIAANKVSGIRAVNVSSVDQAVQARQHLDANVLALSGDWLSTQEVADIVAACITTPFEENERHIRRLAAIAAYESEA
jgi:ribose 5-phosphate isomerase B